MANRSYPKILTATTVIPFADPVTYIPPKTITGPTTFTKTTTGAQAGYCAIIRVVADGTNAPDLSAFKSIGTGTYDNTNGAVNQLWFVFDGVDYCVAITHPTTVGGGGGDTTPPTVNGMVASAATSIFVTFNETVNTPSLTGWSFKKNGSALTPSGVSAVTGTVWQFTVPTMAGGDTITASYNSGVGSVQDLAGNPLASFTDSSVSNTIGATTLNAPTGLTLGTATSSTQPLSCTDTNSSPNETGYKVYRNTVNTFGSATLVTTTAANATSYTVTGLTASTLYYYWVIAAGNGTSTLDSSAATANGSTASGSGYDVDADAYFTAVAAAGGSLTTGQKDAYNAWVLAEKSASRYTKYATIYPFMGGTAATHAINAKNPGTYNITWNGSQTHDANGARCGGTTSDYGDTGYSANNFTVDDAHFSIYINDDNDSSGYDMGYYGASALTLARISTTAYTNIQALGDLTTAATDLLGMNIVTRVSSTQYHYVKAGTVNTQTNASTGTPPGNMLIGINGGAGPVPSTRRYAFATMGSGLTSTEAQGLNTNTVTLQTALSRN